jgi:uncharacterized membrane protein YdjX (TVP38/TMEM64 family)
MTSEQNIGSERSTQLSHMNSRTHLIVEDSEQTSAPLEEEEERRGCCAGCSRVFFHPSTRGEKITCAILWTLMFVLSIVLFSVIFPRFVDKVVQPLIRVMQRRFTPAQIAAIIFTAYVILPLFVVLPFNWTAWLAGAVFQWWVGFLVIGAACTTGMILQYLLGRTILHSRLERSLAKRPNKSLNVTLRAIELAGPMKVVALLRLGPFPYGLLNYLLAVPKSITFWRYILPSVPAEMPSRLMQVYFGQNLGTIADLFRGRIQNPTVAAYNIVSANGPELFVLCRRTRFQFFKMCCVYLAWRCSSAGSNIMASAIVG